MAQLVTADLERGRREEADRIVVKLDATLRATDDAAAAQRARLAQLEVEKRARAADAEKLAAEEAAKNAAIARAEAQLDDRQHSARQRMAQLVTADLERGRREEADRIVVELEATLRAADDAAAAERARAAAAEKLAGEEAAKNAAIARAEAQLDDRQHSARQRTAQLVTADLERGRREEADRIVVELDKTLQSGDDMTSVIAKQRNTNERVKSAKIAKASAEVEDLLMQAAGERPARSPLRCVRIPMTVLLRLRPSCCVSCRTVISSDLHHWFVKVIAVRQVRSKSRAVRNKQRRKSKKPFGHSGIGRQFTKKTARVNRRTQDQVQSSRAFG